MKKVYVIIQKVQNQYITEGEPGYEVKSTIGIHDSLESAEETVRLITSEDQEFLSKYSHLVHIKQKLSIVAVELNQLINI